MATKISSFLATIASKSAVETTKTATESAKAVLDLAKTVKEKSPDVATLKPYAEQMSSLLDLLNSPLAAIVKDAIPFASIGVTLLNLVYEATKKDPTLEECMALIVQGAYLESFKLQLAADEKLLSRIGEKQVSRLVAQQVHQLAELEISDRDARLAIVSFQESGLASELNWVLQARLEDAGLAINEAALLCDRVSRTVPRILSEELAKAADQLKPLAELYRLGGQAVLERTQSLEDYLTKEIASKPQEKVFDEKYLTFQDLYVRLKVQLLDQDGKAIDESPIDLETWAEQQLLDPREQNRVLFVQGEAGRGKSVFCRMFSDRVRRKLYPSFMPIVIRLRDLRRLESNLTQTLENRLETWQFVTSNPSWLTDSNTRFLFLLDGFDELLLEGRASGGLKEFLQQIEDFQRNSHHRFVITGRPLSLQNVDRLLTQTKSLVRVAIQPMNDEIRQRWIAQWAQQFGTEEAHRFSQFLDNCPEEVKNDLAREPLLLYLLARLHREQRLNAEMLQTENKIDAKVLIYDEAVKWVLDKQREDENFRLTGLEPEELRRFLTEAALCVVQAGNEFAPIRMLEMRCVKDANNAIAKLIQKARQNTETDETKALNSLLTAFYIKPASGDKGGSVEFTHKSFGEFLCAERLRDAIVRWTAPGIRPDPFYVENDQLYREIYDLLGSPVLSVEVVEFLMALLTRSNEFKPVKLFERLNIFYELWYEGTFIDALPGENLPQEKMRLLREQLPEQEKPLGLRQVDVYAGLNVLILLLELHRYARSRDELKEKIVFYLDGQPTENYAPRLLNVISYSDCAKWVGFSFVVGAFLAYANLHNATLYRANFAHADFYFADLSDADLAWSSFYCANLDSANLDSADLHSANFSGADLYFANLRNANLARSNFYRANLYSTDFSNANLHGADLSSAYFHRANLCGAILDKANLSDANFESIVWDNKTSWKEIRGLETAKNIPIALKQQLGLE
ncbi:pentapeptide repeat-containing protein [Pseudanabaenaceae cyanobacterium LEGE 13415]|nr:pentapeptide repeat-containing protein [Pseudanabaenaceae cyanobacterium LEGE 13415]